MAAPRPRLRTVLVAIAAVLAVAAPPTVAPARAQGAAAPAVAADWRTVVDPDHGFALRLPPSHDLARGDGVWYVHGWLDGMTLVPDVSITLLRGVAPDEALADGFPAGAEATPVELGPATRGVRVTAPYEAPDGTPYEATSYLVEASSGTFRIDRYEGFDWPPFEAVARSFHLVELVGPMPAAP